MTALWAVAGCLFEVSVPVPAPGPWRWTAEPAAAVTLLSEHDLDTGHHFRFRAEVPGAVELRFDAGGVVDVVLVRVAPEDRLGKEEP